MGFLPFHDLRDEGNGRARHKTVDNRFCRSDVSRCESAEPSVAGDRRRHKSRRGNENPISTHKKIKAEVKKLRLFGRGGRTRTHDPWFWRPVLYQLSYTPMHPYIILNFFRFVKSFLEKLFFIELFHEKVIYCNLVIDFK